MNAWSDTQWARLRKFSDTVLDIWPQLKNEGDEDRAVSTFDPSSLRAFKEKIEVIRARPEVEPPPLQDPVSTPEEASVTAPLTLDEPPVEEPPVEEPESSTHGTEPLQAVSESDGVSASTDSDDVPTPTDPTESPVDFDDVTPRTDLAEPTTEADPIKISSSVDPHPEVTEIDPGIESESATTRNPTASPPNLERFAAADFFAAISWDRSSDPILDSIGSDLRPNPTDSTPKGDTNGDDREPRSIPVVASIPPRSVPSGRDDTAAFLQEFDPAEIPAATFFNQIDWSLMRSEIPASADPSSPLAGVHISIQPRTDPRHDSIPSGRNPLTIGAGQAIRASEREAAVSQRAASAPLDPDTSASRFFSAIRWNSD